MVEDASALPQSSTRRQALAILAGICSESALLEYAAGHLYLALLIGGTSSAVLSWSLATSETDDAVSATRLLARNLLAVLLLVATVIVVFPRLASHHFHGFSGASTGQNSSQLGNGKTRSQPKSGMKGDSAFAAQDAYSGIVLWPKKQSLTKLIAPSPLLWTDKFARAQRSNPLVIPFNGVYWFFRQPDRHPPPQSREAQGTPEVLEIHSTDWRPLSMEAHQNLGDLVDLSCCSRVEISIRNADRYPRSISLELVLVDNSSPTKSFESLGRTVVDSTPTPSMDENSPPKAELLKFAIPPNGALRHFDEVAVVFRLDGYRAHTGAKIGIDHFTLVPRGM